MVSGQVSWLAEHRLTRSLRVGVQVMLVALESAPGGLRVLARHSAALAAALLRLLQRAALPPAALPPAGPEPGSALTRPGSCCNVPQGFPVYHRRTGAANPKIV